MYCVYFIINQKNGKCYIGYTKNFKKRMNTHFKESVWKAESYKVLYKAMKKHGKKNFKGYVLEYYDTKELATSGEIKFINLFKDAFIKLYNMTNGGDEGGFHINKFNTETDKKCSRCNEIKPNSMFSKNKNTYWGMNVHVKNVNQNLGV